MSFITFFKRIAGMQKRILASLLFFILFFPGSLALAEKPKELDILRITPSGDNVRPSRQIVIEFNRPVVPLGRMERTAEEVGISIEPALNCQWRWLNTSSLSCNLGHEESMNPATTYNLQVEPVIEAEDGGMIEAAKKHSFTTQRPDVSYTSFRTWRGPGSPVIRLIFNQPVAKSSVEQHLFMTVEESKLRHELNVYPDEFEQKLPDYMLLPSEKIWVRIEGEERQSDDRKTEIKGEEARRVWLVEPQEPLPLDARASLRIEPGLVSAEGPEEGKAQRDIVRFYTFPEFDFAGVRCFNYKGEETIVKPGEKQTEETLCNPMRPVSLAFTSPVLRSQVKNLAEFKPDLAGGRKDYNPWGEENRDWSQLDSPHREDRLYFVGLPAGLKAAQEYRLSLPGRKDNLIGKLKGLMKKNYLEDEFGRTLPHPVEMSFATAHRNPNFEMPYRDVVLEKGIDSEPPLYVNNLDSYSFRYRSVTGDSESDWQDFRREVNNIEDVQYAVPTGVREMLGGQTGALFGYLETDPFAIDKGAAEYPLFAQVTPWQVHLKLGHFSSLVWVTDLATGQPVEGAKVSLYKDSFTELSTPEGMNIAATALTDESGIAILPGTSTIDPDQRFLTRWRDSDTRYFLRVDKDGDMALLPLSNEFSLQTWNFSEDRTGTRNADLYGHMKSWGFTAQGVYRAGDTIQYKIYLRNQNDKTMIPPDDGYYKLEITDPTGKTVQEIKELKFSEFGAYSGEYAIPESAAVGWYDFRLGIGFGEKPKFTLHPMRVLVSDFTPAPFKVSLETGGDQFHPGDKMNIDMLASLHSGGAYGNASVRSTITLKKGYFTSDHPAVTGFTFGTSQEGRFTEQLFQKSATLSDKGEWSEEFVIPQQPIYYGSLEVESAVQDDRGKSVAAMKTAEYIGVDRFAGLKSTEWFYKTGEPVNLKTVVVDENGAPVVGSKINVKVEREEVTVAKVKGAGNAYLSDITREWVQAAECNLTSKAEPDTCTFTPGAAGTYRAIATVTDTKNREHITEITLWVSGSSYVQWNDQDNLLLPITPEKKGYKVGDTARFLVKNPYPGATALVTIERYGIIEHFTKKLEGSASILEIPVKPDYLPGFYLSVVVTSPRVDAPPARVGEIDMSKPAFRMGYVRVPVRDPYKEIEVTVKTGEEVYRPRDKVKVSLQASPRHAPEKAEPIELAVTVLDEAVFDLIAQGRSAFDPYEGFYDLEPLDMRNYSLLYRLIGRQKFEKKGANPGGDGGGTYMRTIFKYVSYWNPDVKTDASGKAELEFEAPDNLTGWRVLAVAVTPSDRMGLGEGSFKVNRPTELRPVMPNQVHEGDEFEAGFSIMNRTDHQRTIEVALEATGNVAGDELISTQETVTLEPYQRQTVYLPLQADLLPLDRNSEKGSITFSATATDKEDSDGVEHTLPILKKRVVDVAANYGTTTELRAQENIAFPEDIYTDTGGVSVVLSPSVIANLSGAFEYIRDYPYPCWEQILTKGVMAAHYLELKDWLPDTLEWEGAESLAQKTLDRAAVFQAPNGGMAYFIATDQRVSPYLSAYTALAFEWLKEDGYKVPVNVEDKLHAYLQNFLRQDIAPDFYQGGMASTVRAVALAALTKAGKADSADVLRYRPHLEQMSLFGKAHFLKAAMLFDETKAAADEALDMIFASGSESGGKFIYSEVLDDGYLRLLTTPLRDNCAVLSAFLDYGDNEKTGDKPFKLVRTITQSRGKRDHWENTQENMFCMSALAQYAKAYESVKPDMKVSAALDNESFGQASFNDVRDEAITLEKPINENDPGQKRTLTIERKGEGRLYYATRLRYALVSPPGNVNAGFDVGREYSVRQDGKWRLLGEGETIKRGDNIRVDLYVSLPTARNFVVVNDPLPGGLETVNRDLATASSVDNADAQYDREGGSIWFRYNDWREYNVSFWSFYHRELRHDSARFYADWLPAGNYHLSYMTQAIADGTFAAPPVMAEEMYDPDIYGRGESATLAIQSD